MSWVWNDDYQTWFPVYTQHPVYDHLHNFRAMTTQTLVGNQIAHVEANKAYGTVFYYGHRNLRSIGIPYPDYSYGFMSQASPNAPAPLTIWDSDHIFPHTTGKHQFVFLWACENGNIAGNSNPETHGMPYAWTRQANLNPDGYTPPVDPRGYAFIGFERFSPTLQELTGPNNNYKNWLVFFYYWALNGKSINQALHEASKNVGWAGWDFDGNRLSEGWYFYYHGGPGGNPPAGNEWGKMRIYGNGDIYLPQGG